MTGCEIFGFAGFAEKKDWTEEAMLTVASEHVIFYQWKGDDMPVEVVDVKDDNLDYWHTVPLIVVGRYIEGFTYEKGYEYRLKVLKIHLANPPADGVDFKYKLISIISKTQTVSP
jgi:hypothetical protein